MELVNFYLGDQKTYNEKQSQLPQGAVFFATDTCQIYFENNSYGTSITLPDGDSFLSLLNQLNPTNYPNSNGSNRYSTKDILHDITNRLLNLNLTSKDIRLTDQSFEVEPIYYINVHSIDSGVISDDNGNNYLVSDGYEIDSSGYLLLNGELVRDTQRESQILETRLKQSVFFNQNKLIKYLDNPEGTLRELLSVSDENFEINNQNTLNEIFSLLAVNTLVGKAYSFESDKEIFELLEDSVSNDQKKFFTEQEYIDYNKELPGAIQANQKLTGAQAETINRLLTLDPDNQYQAGDLISEEDANLYNSTIEGSKYIDDAKEILDIKQDDINKAIIKAINIIDEVVSINIVSLKQQTDQNTTKIDEITSSIQEISKVTAQHINDLNDRLQSISQTMPEGGSSTIIKFGSLLAKSLDLEDDWNNRQSDLIENYQATETEDGIKISQNYVNEKFASLVVEQSEVTARAFIDLKNQITMLTNILTWGNSDE